jgi:membrane fusion protein (multidrug efflux system)
VIPIIETRSSNANRAAAVAAGIHKTVSGASCHVRSEPFSLDIHAANLARSI